MARASTAEPIPMPTAAPVVRPVEVAEVGSEPELAPPGDADFAFGNDDPVAAPVDDENVGDEDEPSSPFLDRSDGRKASWSMGA